MGALAWLPGAWLFRECQKAPWPMPPFSLPVRRDLLPNHRQYALFAVVALDMAIYRPLQ